MFLVVMRKKSNTFLYSCASLEFRNTILENDLVEIEQKGNFTLRVMGEGVIKMCNVS